VSGNKNKAFRMRKALSDSKIPLVTVSVKGSKRLQVSITQWSNAVKQYSNINLVFSHIVRYIKLTGKLMKEVDLMIFDFDGTLADTGVDLAWAVNNTLDQMGYKRKTREEIITFVGDGITELIRKVLGNGQSDRYSEALGLFRSYYEEHLLDNTVLYPDVADVLNHFHGKPKIIMTNKLQSYAETIARGLNIDNNFIEIIGDGSTPYKKPDKRLIEYLLSKYGGKKEKMIIIGDGMNDINLAKNSGISSCIYLNGLGNRKELLSAKADYYCESLSEIKFLFS